MLNINFPGHSFRDNGLIIENFCFIYLTKLPISNGGRQPETQKRESENGIGVITIISNTRCTVLFGQNF